MAEISVKLLLVGDSCVGKTSLLLQYTENNFPDAINSDLSLKISI